MIFFGEEDTGLKFSEEQQMFFKSKLSYLDPENLNQIQFTKVLQFLNQARITGEKRQKILTVLKLKGKPFLDYTQMKKVFRGVALAQNKLDPSIINILANIKTKMPQFYDSDSEPQENQPHTTQPIKAQNKNPTLSTGIKTAQVQQSLTQFTTPQNYSNQQTIQNRQNQKAQQATQTKKSNETDKNLKKYEDFWSTLSTEDNTKISGNQVKRLFGNSQNRKQLSKIWKLCNHAYKGSLSKGELYVFVSLMKSKSGVIPTQLTADMKQIISKIDGQLPKQKKGTEQNPLSVSNHGFDFDKSHNFDKTQAISPKAVEKIQNKPSGQNRMSASSQDFADFANFANFSPNQKKNTVINQQPKQNQTRIQTQTTKQLTNNPSQKNEKVQLNKSAVPVQNESQTNQKIQIPQIHKFPGQNLQLTQSLAYNQFLAFTNTILPQIQMLSNQNKQATVILDQTNQLLSSMDQAYSFLNQKINDLKIAQDQTNHRLNLTCIRMRNVIEKQNQLISYAINGLQKQVQTGVDRVVVLQGYSADIQNQVNKKVGEVSQIQKRQQSPENQAIPTHQSIQQRATYNQRGSIKINEIVHQANSNDNQMYNKKSMESMRQMTESMAVKKGPKRQNFQTNQDETGGAIYTQKIREKNQNNIQSPRNNIGSANQNIDQRQSGGYHWDIAERKDLGIANNFKKTDSQQSEQDESQKKQRIKAQALLKQEQQAKAQQQKQRQMLQQQQQQQQFLLAQQQQSIMQAQQQAMLQAQQQAMIQAQQQAMLQKQQQELQAHQQQQQQILARYQNKTESDIAREHNIKMKQVRLIQMINFIQPIKKEEYPAILSKVLTMTESQLDATYAQLYKKYLVKVSELQREAFRKGTTATIVAMPSEDDFKTNNFKNGQDQQV